MARKSRKKNVNPAVSTIHTVAENRGADSVIADAHMKSAAAYIADKDFDYEDCLPTAVYARLSIEDNGQADGDSIGTQIKMVEDYVNRQRDMALISTFIDNGYSGTNFDRPQFKAMMEKVKSGKIRCIAVKDLSRFGRNYVELGYYIEDIFPLLNVRLVAVNDNFDSFRKSDRDSLSIPIKNMVNAAYARDISKKQSSVLEMKRRLGIHRMPYAPYGYRFDEHRNLVRDPETAPYVRMIFSWAVAGVARSVIAKRLRYMGIPTPMDIQHEQGRNLSKSASGWNAYVVKGILGNPVYAGTIAMGKTKRSLCNGIAPTSIGREDWIYHYDRHEQIVSKEDYKVIEDMIAQNKKATEERIARNAAKREGLDASFRKIVWCAECGRPMPFIRGSHSRADIDNPTFGFYRCNSGKKVSCCENRKIQQNLLKIIVTDQIREMVEAAEDKKKVLEKIKSNETPDNRIRYYKRYIMTKRRDAENARNKLMILYTDFSDGLLEEEDYHVLKEKTIAEAQALEAEARAAEAKLLEMEKAVDNYIRRAEELETYLDHPEFDESMVRELVERIDIYNGNKVTVTFKCADVMENQLVEECLRE